MILTESQLWAKVCDSCVTKKKYYGDGYTTPRECYPCDECELTIDGEDMTATFYTESEHA